MENFLHKTYEVNVANHPFLFKEARACAQVLLDSSTSWNEVSRAVKEDNLLETKSASTASTYLRAIKARLEGVPDNLLRCLSDENDDMSKFTLFYILLNKNRLLRECLEEIIRDHALDQKYELSKGDLENFFEEKRSKNEDLKSWSDTTWRKFWQNTLKAIQETGILTGKSDMELNKVDVPKGLKSYLIMQDEEIFLHLMLDKETFPI